MLETLLAVKRVANPPPLYGTPAAGFYAIKTEAEVISAAALATAIGLTAGTPETSVPPSWLEFSLQGKRCLYATRAFRYGLSWDQIYNAGAALDVFGDQGVPSTVTVRVQNAEVTIGGQRYRVRLMTMAEWVSVVPSLTGTWVPSTLAKMNISDDSNGAARWILTSNGGSNPNKRRQRGQYSVNFDALDNSTSGIATTGWSPLLEPIG